ncbi:MAG: chromosome condensation regulator RCC1 [Lysobacteraceae bacterium]|nr:MAG: chromosome condensation regulator RCC1 [Xanthomonadaceae bacterium]
MSAIRLPIVLVLLSLPGLALASPIRSLAAGHHHTCALEESGTVRCWGDNFYGQLGDGTRQRHAEPRAVPGLGQGAIALDTHGAHACALTRDGEARCWGRNHQGQLGDGSTSDRALPVTVQGLPSGPTRIATGGAHSCAVDGAGALYCWGRNDSGQLGDGTMSRRTTAVAVSGLGGPVRDLALGDEHSCARTDSGVYCWGWNGYGQLGDGSTTSSATPVSVQGLANVVSIHAGAGFSCAIDASGNVYCWGQGHPPRPTLVSGLPSAVAQLDGGNHHTCVIAQGGTLRCWGLNLHGQIGDGTTQRAYTPTRPAGLGDDIVAVATGLYHTCAATSTGTMHCWGDNHLGQGGDGDPAWHPAPIAVDTAGHHLVAIRTGTEHTCALAQSGTLLCWGSNRFHQLGDGSTEDRALALPVPGLAGPVIEVGAGGAHTCARLADGAVQCWGSNTRGQLGLGDTQPRDAPTTVNGLAPVRSLAVGDAHTCAVLMNGGALCWGDNYFGGVGDGTTDSRTLPTPVQGLGSGMTRVFAGLGYSCALDDAGTGRCWGANRYGQSSQGNPDYRVLVPEPATDTGVLQGLGLGGFHACSLRDGGMFCWGYNGSGQLGDGSESDRRTPQAVEGLDGTVLMVGSGHLHQCAVLADGQARCWGDNAYGQLGDGTTTSRSRPVQVTGIPAPIVAISASIGHTCAVDTAGKAWCWGDDRYGQLGSGRALRHLTPSKVHLDPRLFRDGFEDPQP